ncbi:MAG TPA: hypothetical protein EYQ57_01650 [Methylococcaceae bacterium]|nr:hypothetical protein [Methylococcaceae bacterium]
MPQITKQLAVLIAAENTRYPLNLLSSLNGLKHGDIHVKTTYGDGSSAHLKNGKEALNQLAIEPIQQFS